MAGKQNRKDNEDKLLNFKKETTSERGNRKLESYHYMGKCMTCRSIMFTPNQQL